jgi:hypothetical protein
MADYYQTLGVSRDASADELQQAYRKLARLRGQLWEELAKASTFDPRHEGKR